ncbi:phosphoadenosine phosphosulfate reductase [Yoonia sp. I 8.24]|uniref:phosphoadenosine phosphosulfate reductase n=1 Tax=Yoonia sp. I 8.24 TaxID=1537229 RepID=UPI001EDE3037|nr:phosphoadenosine phosphosulfate reductase [Yoonia sp. I 8.24]MCG3267438.1 phosphoadenosine phosphosulfate reductase [Yoonia sp. I 8.24]
MDDKQLTFETHLTNASQNAWLGQIDDICEDFGFFEQLGARHCAGFLEAGNNLLVTFENVPDVRANNAMSEPRGFSYARHDGWSHLAILAYEESWFRDESVYDFFDRLTDDAFFDDFENIVFYGANGGAYAAAAFSVAAPGATVVALRPQATLEVASAGWDTRYRKHRRMDFTGRYGYAPDMIDGARDVFVAFDPYQRLDASHAALFRKPHVTLIRCPLMGANLDQTFDRLGISDVILKLAMSGVLDKKRFTQLLRARRYDDKYAINLITKLLRHGHPRLALTICEYKIQRSENPYFTKTREALSFKKSA